MTQQSCLICGRQPSDAHHLRFAQSQALGRKASDEFMVPLCRGHHREVHRSGDEAKWWESAIIDKTLKMLVRCGYKRILGYCGFRRILIDGARSKWDDFKQ